MVGCEGHWMGWIFSFSISSSSILSRRCGLSSPPTVIQTSLESITALYKHTNRKDKLTLKRIKRNQLIA